MATSGCIIKRNVDMRREIAAAVSFLERLVIKREKLESHKADLFVERLVAGLQERYKGHWYPDKPSRGQAYRCIRINQTCRQDLVLLRACRESGLSYSDLSLPLALVLWVDPGEVCYRFGEEYSSIGPIASFTTEDEDNNKAATSTHTSSLTAIKSCNHQALNPNVPAWVPKKMVLKMVPEPQHSYRTSC